MQPVNGIAARAASIAAKEAQLSLITDAIDLLVHCQIPEAIVRMREVAVALRRAEAREAELFAAVSHARTVEQLKGVLAEENRIGLIGERTQTLLEAAQQAAQAVKHAEDALHAERARQKVVAAQRVASRLLTRAEIIAAKYEAPG